jgi:hypothetical protein
MPATASVFSIIYLIAYLFGAALGTVVYVVTAFALFKIAKACGLKYPWMSFIPVASSFLLGQIADTHCHHNEGKKTSYRKILLGLEIALLAITFIVLTISVVMFVMAMIEEGSVPDGEAMLTSVVLLAFAVLAVAMVLLVVAVIYAVFSYIALYKIFKLFDSSNAPLYIVLCIFFSIAQPIILLLLARKEPVFLDTAEEPNAGYTPVFSSDYSL